MSMTINQIPIYADWSDWSNWPDWSDWSGPQRCIHTNFFGPMCMLTDLERAPLWRKTFFI